jgi:septum site-determining protein MinD
MEGSEQIKEHLLITRYNPARVDQGQMLSLEDIQDILRIKLIGVIPESESVLQASNQGVPAVHLQGSDVSEAYKDVISRFLGEEKPMRFIEAPKQGLFKRLFDHIAIVQNMTKSYLHGLILGRESAGSRFYMRVDSYYKYKYLRI